MSTARVPVFPGYQDSPKHRGTLVKHAREALDAAGHPGEWHVQHFDGQTAVMALAPAAHPEKAKIMLAPNFTLVRAPEVLREAKDKGLTVVEFVMDLQPGSRYAVAARVTPAVAVLTGLLAGELGKFPHEIALNAVFSPDGHVEKVWVRNLPTTMSAEKLEATLRRFVAEIPGGNSSWGIDVDRLAGQGVLSYCPPERLPGLVNLEDILPDRVHPELWHKIAIGVDSKGNVASHDLTDSPHFLTAGPTGSGKTVGLVAMISSALSHSHSVVIVDPIKGVDFTFLEPFTLAAAYTLPEAQKALEMVYAEGMRRKALLKQHGMVKAHDFSHEDRVKFGLLPITVLVDEFGSLALEATIPKSLPKDHPLVVKATKSNEHKAIIKMILGEMARELRFVGVHVSLALQRPDVAIMGSGELRSNLGATTQLVPPSGQLEDASMRMMFSAEALAQAWERVQTLSDGRSKGLGVMAGETGDTQGVRVAYMDPRKIPALLDRIGVPRVEKKWDLSGDSQPGPDWSEKLEEQRENAPPPDFAPVPVPDDNGINPATGKPFFPF